MKLLLLLLLLLLLFFNFLWLHFFKLIGDNVYTVIFFCVSKTVLPILYSVYDIQMYKIIYYTYNVEYLSRRYVEWWIVTGMIQHICKLMTYGSFFQWSLI